MRKRDCSKYEQTIVVHVVNGGGEIQFSLHILEKMIRLRTLVLSNVDIGEPAISVRSCWLCPYW